MSQFFQFEIDFVESLRCIPMQVRIKLDTCGIKLKLPQWHQLNQAERQTLVDLPCTSPDEAFAYRDYLQKLVEERTGTPASELPIEEHPEWLKETEVPTQLQEKAQEFDVVITPETWSKLSPVQRFALIKLSRAGHENHNFLPALQEFNLA